jgi:hypothetical protein
MEWSQPQLICSFVFKVLNLRCSHSFKFSRRTRKRTRARTRFSFCVITSLGVPSLGSTTWLRPPMKWSMAYGSVTPTLHYRNVSRSRKAIYHLGITLCNPLTLEVYLHWVNDLHKCQDRAIGGYFFLSFLHPRCIKFWPSCLIHEYEPSCANCPNRRSIEVKICW